MKIEEGYMPYLGYKTYYRIVGETEDDKKPLLLLHGGPGSTHNYFEVLDEVANTGHQLIMYDQIGCGKSSMPKDNSLWTPATWVNELIKLRDYLHLDEVHLLGQSWGGMLELLYVCNHHPAGIKSMVLASTLPSSKLWAQEQHRMIKFMSYDDREAIYEAERTGNFNEPKYLAANERYMERHTEDEPNANSPEPLRRKKNAGTDAYLYGWGPNEYTPTGTLKDYDVTDQLKDIDIPTLITSGTNDLCTPLVAKTMFDRISNAKWQLFSKSRHMSFVEQHDAYVDLLEKWLDQND